jgi:hypothetical protein
MRGCISRKSGQEVRQRATIFVTKGRCGSNIVFHATQLAPLMRGYNSRKSGQAVRQRGSYIVFHATRYNRAAAGDEGSVGWKS